MDLEKFAQFRVAGCREALDDGKSWSFYLLNDNCAALDEVLLYEVGYEWGNWGNTESVNVSITGLGPGKHALIWRDDGSGAELRMDLWLRVKLRGKTVALHFEFPKLYRLKNLQLVDDLGKPGWVETARISLG